MEQRLNVLQNKQISSEAHQLSIGYQLGAPKDELKVSATLKRILGGLVCLVIGLIALLSTMTSLEAANQDMTGLYLIMLPLCLLLLALGIYYLFYPIIFGSWRVYIYSEGFVYKRGMKIDVFRWDHIQTTWMWNIKHYRNGIYAGTTHKYIVLREDGLKITLNDKFSGVERLGDRISQDNKLFASTNDQRLPCREIYLLWTSASECAGNKYYQSTTPLATGSGGLYRPESCQREREREIAGLGFCPSRSNSQCLRSYSPCKLHSERSSPQRLAEKDRFYQEEKAR